MTDTRKVMQQALDALESRCGTNAEERGPGGVIEALREALAQQGEQPVAWVLFRKDEDGLEPVMFYGGKDKPTGEFKDRFELHGVWTAPVAQQGEQPVAELIRGEGGAFRVAPNMDALKAIYALPAGTHKLYAGAAPARR